MVDYKTVRAQSQEARLQNTNNQPILDNDVKFALAYFARAVTRAKALVLIKLLPHLPEDKQNLRSIAKILDVSHETVNKWIKNYGFTKFADEEEGENT